MMGLQNPASDPASIDGYLQDNNINSVDRSKTLNSLDRRGGAHCEIGNMTDPQCSKIDLMYDEHTAIACESPLLLATAESKVTIGDFYKDFPSGPEEKKESYRGLNTVPQQREKMGLGSFSESPSTGNSNTQEFVKFRGVPNEQMNPSWNVDEF